MNYTQLTQVQRYQIYSLKKMEHSQTEIVACIGVHKSTISREMRRNQGGRGYRPKQAQEKAVGRRLGGRQRISEKGWQLVEEKLRLDWSPEQISNWLKKNAYSQICHDYIYKHIYSDKRNGGDLHTQLRCQKKRRKRRGSYDRRGKIRNQVSIEQRPEIVDQRLRLGD